MQVSLRNTTTGLDEELTLTAPLLLESLSYGNELIALDIVQHDDICAGVDGLIGLLFRSNLNVEQETEAADEARLLNGGGYGPFVCYKYGALSLRSSYAHHGTKYDYP